MAIYIDIEELKLAKFTSQCTPYMIGWNDAIDAVIDNATAADVVEVVRCKDCTHFKQGEAGRGKYMYCELDEYEHLPTDFCNEAERKEQS